MARPLRHRRQDEGPAGPQQPTLAPTPGFPAADSCSSSGRGSKWPRGNNVAEISPGPGGRRSHALLTGPAPTRASRWFSGLHLRNSGAGSQGGLALGHRAHPCPSLEQQLAPDLSHSAPGLGGPSGVCARAQAHTVCFPSGVHGNRACGVDGTDLPRGLRRSRVRVRGSGRCVAAEAWPRLLASGAAGGPCAHCLELRRVPGAGLFPLHPGSSRPRARVPGWPGSDAVPRPALAPVRCGLDQPAQGPGHAAPFSFWIVWGFWFFGFLFLN